MHYVGVAQSENTGLWQLPKMSSAYGNQLFSTVKRPQEQTKQLPAQCVSSIYIIMTTCKLPQIP